MSTSSFGPDRGQTPLQGGQLLAAGMVLAAANFIAVLDTTIANVSVPTIAGNLGATSSQASRSRAFPQELAGASLRAVLCAEPVVVVVAISHPLLIDEGAVDGARHPPPLFATIANAYIPSMIS